MATLSKEELLAKDIKLKVYTNQILAGAYLTEREVAQNYGLSRGTARASLISLAREGVLQVHASKGYCVNEHPFDMLLTNGTAFHNNYGFSALTKIKPSEIQSILIDSTLTKKLHAPLGNTIYRISEWLASSTNADDVLISELFVPKHHQFNPSEYVKCNEPFTTTLLKKFEPKISHITSTVSVSDTDSLDDKIDLNCNIVVVRRWQAISKSNDVLVAGTEFRPMKRGVYIKPERLIYDKVGEFIE